MTERQMEVLQYIEDFIAVKGFSPSYGDIATGLNLKSKANIHRIVHRLKDMGFLKLDPHKVRSVETLDRTVQNMMIL
jgi:repressor LexA